MIRIDLGKDEVAGGAPKKPLFDLSFLKKKGPAAPRKQVDVAGTLIILAASAFACLPYLFVSQYREVMLKQEGAAVSEIKEATTAVESEITRYSSFKQDLASFEQQKQLANDRLGAIRRLLTNRGTPVNLLDAIGQSMPSHAWLLTLELNALPTPTLVLSGNAYSNEDISEFVEKLSESIYLSGVTLEEVREIASTSGVALKTFTVKAVPKGFSAPKAETPAAGTAIVAAPAPAAPVGGAK